jgi:hypothetical protein
MLLRCSGVAHAASKSSSADVQPVATCPAFISICRLTGVCGRLEYSRISESRSGYMGNDPVELSSAFDVKGEGSRGLDGSNDSGADEKRFAERRTVVFRLILTRCRDRMHASGIMLLGVVDELNDSWIYPGARRTAQIRFCWQNGVGLFGHRHRRRTVTGLPTLLRGRRVCDFSHNYTIEDTAVSRPKGQ